MLAIFVSATSILGDIEEASSGPSEPNAEKDEECVYETVVVSERFPLSAGATSLNPQEIARSHPKTADDALKLVTGISIVQHGSEGKGHQLLLGGFDAAHGSDVEVLLGGVSLNEPSHVHGQGYLDLYGIVPEAILKIEVAKGPFLPWQGNFATAGSIRFRLGIPTNLRPGIVRTEASHRGRLRAVIAVGPEGASEETFIAVETVYDHGFGPNREARRAVLLAGYRLDLGSKDALTAFVIGQTARFETPGALPFSDILDDETAFHGSHGQPVHGLSDRTLAKFGWNHETKKTDLEIYIFGAARAYSLQENFTGWLLYPEQGDTKRQQQKGGLAGAALDLEQRLPTPFSSALFSGIGWRLDVAEQSEDQVEISGHPWQRNRELSTDIHHVYLFGGWRLVPWSWIELMPSVRLDMFVYFVSDQLEDRGVTDLRIAASPRLATAFPLHDKLTLFADYGRGFRAPEARAMLAAEAAVEDRTLSQYSGGEPRFAICDSVEIGAEVAPIRTLVFRIVGFTTWIDREVVFDHVSNLNLELDGTRRLGAETEALWKPTPWFDAETSFAWIDARFRTSGHAVPGIPVWLASGRLNLGRERGPRGGACLLWIGDRSLAHGATVDGYVRLDVNAGWRFEHFEVTALVDNAFNHEIMEGAYHYASWFDRTETRSAIPEIHVVAGEPLTARLVFTAYL